MSLWGEITLNVPIEGRFLVEKRRTHLDYRLRVYL